MQNCSFLTDWGVLALDSPHKIFRALVYDNFQKTVNQSGRLWLYYTMIGNDDPYPALFLLYNSPNRI